MLPPSSGALATMLVLADGRKLRSLREGEVIYNSGEPGRSVYGIVSGTVRLDWNEAGKSETLGPGSTFGIGALVDTEHQRYATATALSDTRLLELNREQFLFALQELPMFGLEMLHDLEVRLGHLHSGAPGFSDSGPA